MNRGIPQKVTFAFSASILYKSNVCTSKPWLGINLTVSLLSNVLSFNSFSRHLNVGRDGVRTGLIK